MEVAMTDNLRSKIIRLAYTKPEFRGDLLPLLKTAVAKDIGGVTLMGPGGVYGRSQFGWQDSLILYWDAPVLTFEHSSYHEFSEEHPRYGESETKRKVVGTYTITSPKDLARVIVDVKKYAGTLPGVKLNPAKFRWANGKQGLTIQNMALATLGTI
jgi:hypothetical protein